MRILFLNFLFLLKGIPKKNFEYKDQVDGLDLLKNYPGSIVISSAPITGALTIIQCWGFKLPVLIYDPQIYYKFCNFSKE